MSHFLPPGPWDARGNKVTVGNGRTICTVFYPSYASKIAEEIARLPDLLEEIAELKARVEELESKSDDNFWEMG